MENKCDQCENPNLKGLHTCGDDGIALTSLPINENGGPRKLEDLEIVLQSKLEELFPKGCCKERGQALVLFAYAVDLIWDARILQNRKTLQEIETMVRKERMDWYLEESGMNTGYMQACDRIIAVLKRMQGL